MRHDRVNATQLSPEQAAEIAACAARRTEALANPALSPLQRLVHWWGDDATSGATGADVDALEARYGIRVPGDFRAYLIATMPKGNEWDSEGTNWWPLADLKSARDECAGWEGGTGLQDDDKVIVFADYLIWCFAWAIDCSEGINRGKVIVLTGTTNPRVAENFDDFLDRYVRDPSSVM